ncbi:hypothetical protein ACHHYP_02756 [Achlya hypogyna]|uniref:RING-type domain-containing protein n=1 Tax=Achlya hypogyna TaxID=1202772 RepID=A0A1V9Z5J8_ACHHY|nr:hypothetical protein ACHHYP_02756 [Achlya hypogyna]
MEEDDCYGFGSYKDVFSAPPGALDDAVQENVITSALTPRSRKRVDATSPVSAVAIGTYLVENNFFVMQREVSASLFHGRHVGLKIKRNGKPVNFSVLPEDSVVVESGAGVSVLGDLLCDDSVLLWKPAHYTDSKASVGHLYGCDRLSLVIPREAIQEVLATRMQNVVPALVVTIDTFDIAFELTFMPGPYHKPTHRDDLLRLLTPSASPMAPSTILVTPSPSKTSPMNSSPRMPIPQIHTPPHPASTALRTPTPSRRTPVRTPLSTLRTQSRRLSNAAPSPHRLAKDDIEARNTLVREYLSLPRSSPEAQAIAVKIHDLYQYPIGPLSETHPSFLDDKDYRKNMVHRLQETVNRMKRVWKAEEQEVEQAMRVRSSRSSSDDVTYMDTNTSHFISPKEYEVRYRAQFEAAPVVLLQSDVRRPEPLDASASCIVDAAFCEAGDAPIRLTLPPTVPAHRRAEAQAQMREFNAQIDRATHDLYQAIAQVTHEHYTRVQSIQVRALLTPAAYGPTKTAFAEYTSGLGVELPHGKFEPMPPSANAAAEPPRATASKRRRRSILLTPTDEAVTGQSEELPTSGTSATRVSEAKTLGVEPDDDSPQGKRQRGDELPTMEDLNAVDIQESTLTPRSLNGVLAAEASSNAARVDSDLNICNLCFDQAVSIVLQPCGHEVCDPCWGKLHSSHQSDAGAIQCPWDRETVEPQTVASHVN